MKHEPRDFCETCASNSEIAEELDINENDVEDFMLDFNIERCGGCEWWFESSQLEFDEIRNQGFCEQCAPELFE